MNNFVWGLERVGRRWRSFYSGGNFWVGFFKVNRNLLVGEREGY